jgi:histidinol-phosphatase
VSDLEFALRLADAADERSRPFVGDPPASKTKADGSPVTNVDVGVERALLAIVQRDLPRDSFLGEEVGAMGNGERRWIVDGIDGTSAFVVGRAEWATLIGLEVGGRLIVGVATAPALGRRWWAVRGAGAWTSAVGVEDATPTRLVVAEGSDLAQARVESWAPPYRDRPEARALMNRLRHVSRSGGGLPWATPRPPGQRPSWGSGHPGGALLVAAGLLDGFVMLAGGPWDHAAPALIVQEAGGRFSDLRGDPRFDTGSAVFTNGRIHDALLGALNE